MTRYYSDILDNNPTGSAANGGPLSYGNWVKVPYLGPNSDVDDIAAMRVRINNSLQISSNPGFVYTGGGQGAFIPEDIIQIDNVTMSGSGDFYYLQKGIRDPVNPTLNGMFPTASNAGTAKPEFYAGDDVWIDSEPGSPRFMSGSKSRNAAISVDGTIYDPASANLSWSYNEQVSASIALQSYLYNSCSFDSYNGIGPIEKSKTVQTVEITDDVSCFYWETDPPLPVINWWICSTKGWESGPGVDSWTASISLNGGGATPEEQAYYNLDIYTDLNDVEDEYWSTNPRTYFIGSFPYNANILLLSGSWNPSSVRPRTESRLELGVSRAYPDHSNTKQVYFVTSSNDTPRFTSNHAVIEGTWAIVSGSGCCDATDGTMQFKTIWGVDVGKTGKACTVIIDGSEIAGDVPAVVHAEVNALDGIWGSAWDSIKWMENCEGGWCTGGNCGVYNTVDNPTINFKLIDSITREIYDNKNIELAGGKFTWAVPLFGC